MLKFSIWKIKQKTGKRLKKPKIGLKWDFYDTFMRLFATKHKKYHLLYTPINQCITNILKPKMILWDFSFKKNSVKFCQAPIYHNWFPRTDIIRHSTGVVTTISLFYNCSQFVTVFLLSILFAIFMSSFWGISIGTKNKRERPLTDHSLSNIMYEKKISCSQDEVYVQ